jgi:hypothetical protein
VKTRLAKGMRILCLLQPTSELGRGWIEVCKVKKCPRVWSSLVPYSIWPFSACYPPQLLRQRPHRFLVRHVTFKQDVGHGHLGTHQ